MTLARLRALLVLSVLGLLAAVTVVWVIANDSQGTTQEASCALKKLVNTDIPEPGEVSLVVLNATDADGLAGSIKGQLESRGFTQVEVGNTTVSEDDTAQVRYGPAAAGAAQLVRAHVTKAAVYPDRRLDARVQLILGSGDVTLTPVEEVGETLRKMGKPQLPHPICS